MSGFVPIVIIYTYFEHNSPPEKPLLWRLSYRNYTVNYEKVYLDNKYIENAIHMTLLERINVADLNTTAV